MKKHSAFLLWLLLNSLVVTGILFANKAGIVSLVYSSDKTFISMIISGLYCITSFIIGIMFFFRVSILGYQNYWKTFSFIGDIMTSLGLLGTFIGFAIMLSTNLSGSIENIGAIRSILSQMSSGFYTALFTSIVGLIGSMLINIQLKFRELINGGMSL